MYTCHCMGFTMDGHCREVCAFSRVCVFKVSRVCGVTAETKTRLVEVWCGGVL